MPTVAEVIGQIDSLIPLAKAGGWDPVGLQIGDRTAGVQTIAVCHEATEDVVRAVEAAPVDLLVAYHPLLFRSTRSFIAGPSAPGRAFRMAQCGTAVAVVHTAYDVARGGVADALADTAGLHDPRGFGPSWGSDTAKIVTFAPGEAAEAVIAAMTAAGAGRIGRYHGCSYRSEGFGSFTPGTGADPAVGTADGEHTEPEVRIEMIAPAGRIDAVVAGLVRSHPYEEPAYDVYDVRANAGFIGRVGAVDRTSAGEISEQLRTALPCAPRVAGADRVVERIAVVPGSGSSFIAAAAECADVLVTGDVSHHDAQDALNRGLAVIDIGHVAGERPGVARLYALISQLGIPVRDLTEMDPDPWS